MEIAKYHKTKSQDTPNPSKMKNYTILARLVDIDVDAKAGISAKEVNQKLKAWVEKKVKAEDVQGAEDAGHEVLFKPPTTLIYNPLSWREH